MIRERSKDRLTDPPHRVTDELYTLLRIELPSGGNQPDVPFLDQVRECHTPVLVLFRDADDESKVGAGKLLDGVLIAQLSQSTQLLFLIGSDELVPAYVPQILVESRLLLDAGVKAGERVSATPLLSRRNRTLSRRNPSLPLCSRSHRNLSPKPIRLEVYTTQLRRFFTVLNPQPYNL